MAARCPDRNASDAELSSTKAKRPGRDPGEIIAVVRRVLSENGRDYLPQYMLAIGCLLAIAILVFGAIGFGPWSHWPELLATARSVQ